MVSILQSGTRYCLANVDDAVVFQSGSSLLTAHHLFIREKKEASGGELSQLPTAKLTNLHAATYVLFFSLQSQRSNILYLTQGSLLWWWSMGFPF